MKPKRIECGSSKMLDAWNDGVEYYQPTAGGHELVEVEAGVTDHSLRNLRDLVEQGIGQVTRIEVGPNCGVLVTFGGLETYLATGFGVGYGGEGPTGLARFAAEQGFGAVEDLRSEIAGLPQDFRGVLCRR